MGEREERLEGGEERLRGCLGEAGVSERVQGGRKGRNVESSKIKRLTGLKKAGLFPDGAGSVENESRWRSGRVPRRLGR